MSSDVFSSVSLTPLKVIPTENGNVKHSLKSSELSFSEFGEAYFSEVLHGKVKGWKLHTKMLLNLTVPVGNVRFVFFNENEANFYDVTIGVSNYQRLTVKPGVWFAFQGIGENTNLVLNIASIEHDPNESQTRPLESISYDW